MSLDAEGCKELSPKCTVLGNQFEPEQTSPGGDWGSSVTIDFTYEVGVIQPHL